MKHTTVRISQSLHDICVKEGYLSQSSVRNRLKILFSAIQVDLALTMTAVTWTLTDESGHIYTYIHLYPIML